MLPFFLSCYRIAWMKDFKKNYIAFLIIAALFVGGIGLFSYSKYKESRVRGEITGNSHRVLQSASEIKTYLFQSLSEHRRYREAGQEEELNKYYKSKDKTSRLIETVSSSASGPNQKDKALKIQDSFIKLTETIESLKVGELATTPSFRKDLSGLMKSINEFIEVEEKVFDARLTSLIALNRNFYIALVGGTFAAFALLMYMNYSLLMAQNREAVMQRKLELLKERQSQSFNATRDGLFEWKLQENDREHAMYWSPRLKEMVGYSDSDLEASAETLEKLMHPDDREKFWHKLHKHLRGEMEEFSSIFRWRHKDGNWVWINARGRAIFNEFKEAVKLVGVHTDVTTLKEYELQLAKSKDEAEKANSAKSDFLAHMSHEIRTPLTAITGVAEILNMQKHKFDEKSQKLMEALSASSIGLRDLISDILDFSKIESGKIALEEKQIDLRDLFENIVSIISVRSSEKNLAFDCNFSEVDGLQIRGDKTRLRQILINLIGNAVKFTNKGHVRVQAYPVEINSVEMLRVDVSDTGIGIESNQFNYIFESFRQADASVSRKYGGTGLGLPIARHLARLMGGDIFVSSTQGEGSLFTLQIPLIKYDEVRKENQPAIHYTLPILNKGEKILVVEDYEGNIAFISHILDEMGIEFDLGRTGLEGLKLWDENDYRLILMDIQMPEMDGISAVKHIRRKEKEMEKHRMPIIAMTAHAFSEDREKCLTAGFDEYLPKPLTKQALFEKMLGLLK